ncbi:hypothetical protein BOX15_Mlig028805g2, partial [Macrostomum lignano]
SMSSRLTRFITSLTGGRPPPLQGPPASASVASATASGRPTVVSDSHRRQSPLLQTPLTVQPEGFNWQSMAEQAKPAAAYAKDNENVLIGRLSNGLTVASMDRIGTGCTVGVVISAGPRFQAGFTKGVSHLVEKMSFGSTRAYPNREHLLSEIEQCGGIFDTQSSKDATIYAMSANPLHLDRLVSALAQVVCRARYDSDEVVAAREKVRFDWEAMEMSASPEPILTDLLYSAAYQANTLGFPKFCPLDNVDSIDRSEVLRYLATYYRPERMILCGIGVPHQPLMQAAESYFADQPDWLAGSAGAAAQQPDNSVAQYTGGEARVEKAHSQMHAALQLPELIHIGLGLESCSLSDEGFVASCVLNMMMGGGGSFSAGGPGKGMYTRLFTRVLNRHYWVNSAQASNQAYADSGLFAIQASAPPQQCRDLCNVIVRELHAMTDRLPHDQVQRAKKQLQSMLLMNLEMRPVVFEDVGRQILSSGERKPPQYWTEQIEQIEERHLRDFAKRMLLSRPSYVAYGPQLSLAPDYSQVLEWMADSGAAKSAASSVYSRIK